MRRPSRVFNEAGKGSFQGWLANSLLAGLIFAVLCSASACLQVTQAQEGLSSTATDIESDPETTAGGDTGTAAGTDENRSSDTASPSLAIKLDEKPGFDPYVAVNDGFATAVDYMLLVLFYRAGAAEEEFVKTDHVEYYFRSRKSGGNFTALHSGQKFGQLTPAQAEALFARGKLQTGIPDPTTSEARPWRDGILLKAGANAGEIEYVSHVINQGAKYVAVEVDGAKSFRKELPPRSQLSEDPKDWLTPADVSRMAAAGELALPKAGTKQNELQPHLLIGKKANTGAPLVVLWLAFGSVAFTLYMRFVNVWGLRHAFNIVRGVYDNPNEPGEVTHFQALSSALSATVGLGNIAGVTIAMTLGGPGAFFWMLLCGVFGMTSKFVECTLGQMYRTVKEDGTVLGGPMQYLHQGLAELRVGGISLGGLGFFLSVLFALMCILASFGGGNMFQANQSAATVLALIQKSDLQDLQKLNADIDKAAAKVASAESTQSAIDQLSELQQQQTALTDHMQTVGTTFNAAFGMILAIFVALVIIGGIKRIGAAASKVVPTMCIVYIIACIVIIAMHITDVPMLIGQIFSQAFNATAIGGGMVGVLVIGVQRAAFSNEAGVGSASIAHSAARTEEPVREGAVALLGPFIDTVIVCSMTALVILITGAWDNQEWIVGQGLQGAALTTQAFRTEIPYFDYVLTLAVVLFAYSTIISWSYYGERCWERLFGPRSIIVYRVIYVAAVCVGAVVHLGAVLDFSDMMILSMAFPNVFGCLLLAPKVRRALAEYWDRYQKDEFKTFK